jgi:hypothetical protein
MPVMQAVYAGGGLSTLSPADLCCAEMLDQAFPFHERRRQSTRMLQLTPRQLSEVG